MLLFTYLGNIIFTNRSRLCLMLALDFVQRYICEVGDLKKEKNLIIAGINRAELPMCLYSMPLCCTYSPPSLQTKNTFYLHLKSHFRSRIIHAFSR